MNGLPYYKAYPRDFIEGTIGMSFELKGAYRLVLDLIYMQGGRLPDDARYISGLLGCSIRKWVGFRDDLVSSGKLTVIGDFLANYRADKELETLAKLQDTKRENRSGSSKNNKLQKRPSDHTEPDTEPDTEQEKKEEVAVVAQAPAAAASQQNPTDREKLLKAMGVGPDGIAGPNGVMIGRVGDMAEARKWSELGVSLEDQCAVIAEVCDRQRKRVKSWVPRGFGYFSPSISEFAARKSAPMPIAQGTASQQPKADRWRRMGRTAA